MKTKNLPANLKNILEEQFFEVAPFNVAIIDKDYRILAANENFENYFGSWEGRRCYETYKKSAVPCRRCKAMDVFEGGQVRVSDEAGVDINGKPCHYIVHLAPLKNKDGKVEYIVEMSLDVTETGHWQREYNILFERVPCYISVIDKNFRVIRANEKFRHRFGELKGRHCYEIYKKKKHTCKNCPAVMTFNDGKDHASTQVGISKTGEKTYYVVNTTPLSRNEDGVNLVIEIATDITEINQLQEQLYQAHDFYATLIENSADAIIALDPQGKTQIMNPSARDLFKWPFSRKPGVVKIKEMLPEEFFKEPDSLGVISDKVETLIQNSDGEEIPVRFNAVELRSKKKELGRVAFLEDLTKIKELEKQKIDAERLGAVGQTVAGLAHTIKNMLMGLEGGVYIVDTGLKKGDAKRIFEGWEILQRNFNKTTELVKDFLSFAKGRLPELFLIDPKKLVKDVVELYFDSAKRQNVSLSYEIDKNVQPALLDPNGIEACLTNLISNAIDAAMLRENEGGKVIVRVFDRSDNLVFQVEDNGAGMDSEVIQKIFTTFFTTKGNKGTGLGLLTTNKIVKEHGGRIEVESDEGRGSAFNMIFPRRRLKLIAEESHKNKLNNK